MMSSRRILKCGALKGLQLGSGQRLGSSLVTSRKTNTANSISIFSLPEKSEGIVSGGLTWFPVVRHVCTTACLASDGQIVYKFVY